MTAAPLQQNHHLRVRQAHFDLQPKYAELASHARFPVTCIALSLIGRRADTDIEQSHVHGEDTALLAMIHMFACRKGTSKKSCRKLYIHGSWSGVAAAKKPPLHLTFLTRGILVHGGKQQPRRMHIAFIASMSTGACAQNQVVIRVK